jgi:hypothetical protein
MIPQLERSTLVLMIVAAKADADEGKLADGYTRLLRGLHHAKGLAATADPGSARLVARYGKAIDEYIARYGVRMETPQAGRLQGGRDHEKGKRR